MTKFYIDCEFIENGSTIDLISIGLVCEDGREYYAISNEFDASKASVWVKENVLKNLYERFAYGSKMGAVKSRSRIKADILEFCGNNPQFWGEWCSYDWVAFCQLFGTMMDLPQGYPMRCRDVIQMCEDELGLSSSELPASLETDGNHNALLGARTVKLRHDWLIEVRDTKAD
jgi:3' exoribonuclease, RNase T-like